MNERKLKKLFDAARAEAPAAPPDGFEQSVLRAIGREKVSPGPSLFDQLNLLFPRVALAAVCVIVICIASDYLAGAAQLPSLTDGVEELSQQWLFTGEGF